MDEGLEGHLQALRSVYKRSSATLTSPPLELPESEIVHVDIHQDPAGKDIVLWADILVAFKGADNVRHKTRVLPFLKDERFHTYVSSSSLVPRHPFSVHLRANKRPCKRPCCKMRTSILTRLGVFLVGLNRYVLLLCQRLSWMCISTPNQLNWKRYPGNHHY